MDATFASHEASGQDAQSTLQPALVPPPSSDASRAIGFATRNATTDSNRSSRTHIPSVTSRAFFAPMSSQALQAHRAQRPLSEAVARPSQPEDIEEHRSVTHRNSFGSAVTAMAPRRNMAQRDVEALPPASRGTEYSDWTSPRQMTASTEDVRVVQGRLRQESLLPLRTPQAQVQALPLNGQTPGVSSASPNGARAKPPAFLSNLKRLSKFPSTTGEAKDMRTSTAPTANGIKQSNGNGAAVSNGNGRATHGKEHTGTHEASKAKAVTSWRGYFKTARTRPVVLVTALLIIAPSVLFFIFSAPWLWHHSSPAIPILFAYIFYICLSSFLHAAFTDPGIFPRSLHEQGAPDAEDDPLAVQTNTRWTLVRSPTSKHGLFEIPTKYCTTCDIWRPPRCHHCRICDRCIETQDHHCVWLSNCVGRRNYRYFFTFIASGALLGMFLFAASIGHVAAFANHNSISFRQSIDHNRVPFAMFIYGVLAFGYPLALLFYHVFLIVRGQTTHEFLNANRFRDLDRHRPFHQTSWWMNLVVVLLRVRPPPYLELLDDDDAAANGTTHIELGNLNGSRAERAGQQASFRFPAGPNSRASRVNLGGPVDATPR